MKVIAALLLVFAPWAAAIEVHDARGLDVEIETMPAPVSVDGVVMQIRIAQGRDVPALARRIEQRWRREGSSLRRLDERGWQLLSRWETGRSELVQWRGEGAAAQLVFSLLDTLQQPSSPGSAPFRLPSACAWGRSIDDGAFSQRSAYCRSAMGSVQQSLRGLLESQGWGIRRDVGASLEVERDGLSGSITLGPGQQPGDSALVWMAIRPGAEALRR